MAAILPAAFRDALSFLTPWIQSIRGAFRAIIAHPIIYYVEAHPFLWEMLTFFAACGLLRTSRWWRSKDVQRSIRGDDEQRLSENSLNVRAVDDPGLLRKHSTIETYTTSTATYAGIRTFYHPHPQADKLPTMPRPLPLLVFIHGLGGSLAQFSSLLTTFVNISPCLGIDLPGCGLSEFSPKSWDAYSHQSLAELINTIIEHTCEASSIRDVVLVAHSMGCSLSVTIASGNANNPNARYTVRGIVAICPKASSPSKEQIKYFKALGNIPPAIFEIFRWWDRRGGLNSPSVLRFVGKEANEDTRKLQLRYNEQSRTKVFLRMAYGAIPTVKEDGTLSGGLPSPEVWGQLTIPVQLMAGAADKVTSPDEVRLIADAIGKRIPERVFVDGKARTANDRQISDLEPADSNRNLSIGKSVGESGTIDADSALKVSVIPSPAAHGMLYDTRTYRTISGLIQDFLASHIDKRLSLGWQLQHFKEANKWDVKNLAKWSVVTPVSEPIQGIFRAMKTLREVDEVHSPGSFVEIWRERIMAVIDISHESPVYNPQGLDDGGIEYHKFPTVSKIPPTVDEVRDFVALVDRLRELKPDDGRLIGVHCHYGFNRTGFFICCYLIERRGFSVQQALDEFAKCRPPGIRHEHFVDTLFVRYCVGLQRAPIF
ncbi:MAG: hypothetical protein LQ340_003702 [Diploschistes diacapsis]|nr:MAG: hypothetical protein LQ340_003702 [Diploschistes diacapsis]